jgi:hypothetical protein
VSTDVSGEITSIFRVEKINRARNQRESRFLARLIFFDPEDGGDIFLRNVG